MQTVNPWKRSSVHWWQCSLLRSRATATTLTDGRSVVTERSKRVASAADETGSRPCAASPGCSLHRSRVAEALRAAGTCWPPTNHRAAAPPRPWPPILPVGIISIHVGCCDDGEYENRRKMGCFKIVEGCVKYRVGRRVRGDYFAVFVLFIHVKYKRNASWTLRQAGRVVDRQLKQSRNSPTHIPRWLSAAICVSSRLRLVWNSKTTHTTNVYLFCFIYCVVMFYPVTFLILTGRRLVSLVIPDKCSIHGDALS